MANEYNVAILLPTRGRTDALSRSVISIINRAVDKANVQLLMGFDNDDEVGLDWFKKEIQPYLDKQGVAYSAHLFDRLGYAGLNRYYNELAKHVDADWIFAWSDDAIMETTGWDRIIKSHTGEFKLLKAHAHNEHPYSIFPMWPKEWYDLFGFVARHQMIDAELSQNAYLLDLMEIVEIYITHDRADLTGNNADETQTKNKVLYEGNPANPLDFHNPVFQQARFNDCVTIANYLKTKGVDMTWFDNVLAGKQDPWIKMRENDINKHMVHYVNGERVQ